jgi:hypothetical protein
MKTGERLDREGNRIVAKHFSEGAHPPGVASSKAIEARLAAGATDVVAREIIGHESAAISTSYSHIDTATLRTAIDKLPNITGLADN